MASPGLPDYTDNWLCAIDVCLDVRTYSIFIYVYRHLQDIITLNKLTARIYPI